MSTVDGRITVIAVCVSTVTAVAGEQHFGVLKRAEIEAVVVDNDAVDAAELPRHHEGYSGLAALKHTRRQDNLFVPAFSGLNLEHIHDGSNQPREVLFEARHVPMQLRAIDDHTAELHQPATPHYGLETAIRYQLLEDGAVEMTVECIPRKPATPNRYLSLFFASYIDKPESLDIHFFGRRDGQQPGWIQAATPTHGLQATHRAARDDRSFPHDDDFGLTLPFHFSEYRYQQPWYYGLRHGMALAYVFRPQDQVRFTQSPSGGGPGCPAWDFQWFIENPQVGKRYRFVMRAVYVPFTTQTRLESAIAPHLTALSTPTTAPAGAPARSASK